MITIYTNHGITMSIKRAIKTFDSVGVPWVVRHINTIDERLTTSELLRLALNGD
jgi:hypothetical protein